MGIVKKCKRLKDNKTFAVKIVKSKDEEIVTNIIKEFQNCLKLDN